MWVTKFWNKSLSCLCGWWFPLDESTSLALLLFNSSPVLLLIRVVPHFWETLLSSNLALSTSILCLEFCCPIWSSLPLHKLRHVVVVLVELVSLSRLRHVTWLRWSWLRWWCWRWSLLLCTGMTLDLVAVVKTGAANFVRVFYTFANVQTIETEFFHQYFSSSYFCMTPLSIVVFLICSFVPY